MLQQATQVLCLAPAHPSLASGPAHTNTTKERTSPQTLGR